MPAFPPEPEQQEVLEATENLVVIGRPGSGKTTVALWKAAELIDATPLADHQNVLFLSFSRGAVERIAQASKIELSKHQREHLRIATYHSLCFEILGAHAPVVGMLKPAQILDSEDEAIIRQESGAGCDDFYAQLEIAESRVRFDRFAPVAVQILKKRPLLRTAYNDAYPLIIVDEYQDTDDYQEELIRLLAERSQLICLGDSNQRIYDFRPNMRSDRLERLVADRGFREITLSDKNHRSAGRGIREYAEAIMAATNLASPRVDIRLTGSKFTHVASKIRDAIGYLRSRGHAEGWAPSGRCTIAVMLPTNELVHHLSRELRALPENVRSKFRHDVLVDLDEVAISWATLTTVLEYASRQDPERGIPAILETILRRMRFAGATGTKRARVEGWLAQAQSGNAGNHGLPKHLRTLLENANCTGDPINDLLTMKVQLEAIPGDYFAAVLQILDVRFPGVDEPRLRQALAEAFHSSTGYAGIVDITRQHLATERLLDTGTRRSPLTLMTIHKCKGKEFDAVVIAEGTGPQDVWIRRDEQIGNAKPKSRRLLHVAITRARQRVVLITPAFRKSELLF